MAGMKIIIFVLVAIICAQATTVMDTSRVSAAVTDSGVSHHGRFKRKEP